METVSVNKVLQLFNMLSKTEQLEKADKIDMQTFEERWRLLDNDLPNAQISEKSIITEVRAVRYRKRNKEL